MVIIHTDGACLFNPGPGARAAIVERDGRREAASGFEAATTSNRMELTAAIEALERVGPGEAARVVSDSQYLVRGMVDWMPRKWRRNGWTNASRDPVANADLWRRLAALAAERTVEWAWVRGHDGDPLNDEAHRLASEELRLRTGLAG